MTDFLSSRTNDIAKRGNPSLLMEEARAQYPYMKDADIGFSFNPSQDNRKLEYWPQGEVGSESMPRPQAFPLNRDYLQVLKEDVRPIDILGDYVSHGAVKKDSVLKGMYDKFSSLVPDEKMRERYDYHVKNNGESRPYDVWKEIAGLPELFRGYTFDQWTPEQSANLYTEDQLNILDEVRSYLGINK